MPERDYQTINGIELERVRGLKDLWICKACGLVVGDIDTHIGWHADVTKAESGGQ